MNSALATVKTFQEAVAASPDLTHQYTFEGAGPVAGMADKVGTAHLTPFASQNWNPPATAKFAGGFSPNSQATLITNSGPGGYGGADGHSLIGSIYLGANYSFEIIFRCDEHPSTTTGSAGVTNMGWLLSTRSDDNARRGYFLWQGQVGTTAGDGTGLGSVCGNSAGAAANGNRVAESLIVGHWYYVAGAYTTDMTAGGGLGQTTWTNYIADLTAGDTTLTSVGPHINPEGSLAPHDEQVRFGVGGRYDAFQNPNPCPIDEVNIYNAAALSQADFQAHLDALYAPQNFIVNARFENPPGPGTTTVGAFDSSLTPPWSHWNNTGGTTDMPTVGGVTPPGRAWWNVGGSTTYVHNAAHNNLNLILDGTGTVKYHFKASYYVPSDTAAFPGQAAGPNLVAGQNVVAGSISMNCDVPAGTTYTGGAAVLQAQDNPAVVLTPDTWKKFEYDWYNTSAVPKWANYMGLRCRTTPDGVTFGSASGFFLADVEFSAAEYRNDLNGLVKDNLGVPVAGAPVTLSSAVHPIIATTTTGADGRYSFTTWVPFYNEFRVDSNLAGSTSDGPVAMTISAASGAFPDLTLTLASAAVSGIVTDEGVPVEGVIVKATNTADPADIVVSTPTAADGTYTLQCLVGKEYQLSASGLPVGRIVVSVPSPFTPADTTPLPGMHLLLGPNPDYIPGLLVRYNFEGDGLDSSGNDKTGSLVGAATYGGGRVGSGALDTRAASGAFSVPDLGPAVNTEYAAFTMSAWMKSTETTGWQALYQAPGWDLHDTHVVLDYSNDWAHMLLALNQGGDNDRWQDNVRSLWPHPSWHLETVVYDSAALTVKFYCDGVLTNTQSYTTAATAIFQANAYIGSTGGNINDRSFRGKIDDFRIYGIALSDTEVADLYASYPAPAATYTLAASVGTGGSISPTGDYVVDSGDNQIFTITPAYGYVIADVSVDGSSVGPVASYTFTDVSANGTIAASFSALPGISGVVSGPDGPLFSAKVTLSTNPDGSSPLDTKMTNALGEYLIAPPDANGIYYVVASKGGSVASSPLEVTMTGASVTGLDIALAKSVSLDPLVMLDAAALAVGTDLATWPNTGSMGGAFNKWSGGTGPEVLADLAGKQAVDFSPQLTSNGGDADRRTLGGTIVTSAEIAGNSDWSVYADLYKADMAANGDCAYLSLAGWWAGGSKSSQFCYRNNKAVDHNGTGIGFNTVPSAAAWHNVIITYDGTTEKVYVDGVLDSSNARALNILTGDQIIIGSHSDVNGPARQWNDQYWRYNGAIAKLQIFDQALTEAEVALLNGIAPPDTYEWAGPNDGQWSDVANWVSAVPVSGKIAVFSNSESAGAAVDIDTPAAAGGIQFNGKVANQLLKSTTASPLTLDNAAAAAPITVTGSHTISADINAPKNLSVSGPGSATLNLSGTIATGTSGAWDEELIKGPNLVLNGTASWTSTGAHYMTVGSPSGATLTINDSATINWTDSWSLFVAWNAGDTGKVVQNGGTVKTQPVGTAWYNNNGPGVQLGGAADPVTAEYDLNGGILITPNVYNVNGKPVTPPTGSAIFRFNGGVLQATQNDNVDDPSVVAEGTTHLMGNLTHAYVGTNGAKIDTATFNCGMDQVLEHDPSASPADGGLTKLGLGTLTLLRDSTYTGPTRVQDGVLACATIASLAPTALEIASAASLELSYTGTQTVPSLKIGGVTKPAGVYDAANTDGHITGTGTVTVSATTPYGTWIAGYPSLSGANALPGADPDGDAMSNQDEFAFGLNPTLGSSVNPITKQLNKTTGQFSYTRLSTSGLAYTVWTSENLVTWTKDTGATQVAAAPVDGVETVAVTLSGSKPLTLTKLFVRVEAQ